MKAILISDHAKWCASMMNGKKKVEVRKGTALYKATQKLINEYGFAEFYVYCTKDKWLLYKNKTENKWDVLKIIRGHKLSSSFNGKVLFKFRCYKVEEIYYTYLVNARSYSIHSCLTAPCFSKECCLEQWELEQYLKGKKGCAIHISDLEVFDKPKELRELRRKTDLGFGGYKIMPLLKAPQSFCYIETGE